ncbi:MAG: NnrS family protein [Deltaproteobacteria bacterium]|nr:NnrS family protein [Deltaproteobacteria bacterium]
MGLENSAQRASVKRRVLFALGFRPFFLMAGFFAVVLVGTWLPTFLGSPDFETYYGLIGWHSHEMIFGYASAVIAGFLLTAVRNWTNIQTAQGLPLATMAALWLAGRVVPFLTDGLSRWLIALVDLSFLPALATAVAIPLVGSGQKRNLFFVPLLGLLTLANLLVHLELNGLAEHTARRGIFLGLNLVLLVIVIMGGRVIPFFTERALPGVMMRRWPAIEWLSVASVLAFPVAEFFFPNSILAGTVAALAAASNGIRLAGWYTRRFWSVPLLWVLHLGYAWIIAGFCLKAFAAASLVGLQYTIHAFSVGGIGVLTLGMMARVSLGHTGRPLKVANSITFAFAIINIAAVARGIFPIALPGMLPNLVALSGGLWIVSFLIFLWVYTPILTSPRVDGQPG